MVGLAFSQRIPRHLCRPAVELCDLFAEGQGAQRRSLLRLHVARQTSKLCRLVIGQRQDCVLLLWTTDPLLPTAFDVIRAWGFSYKTVGFYWAKLNKLAAAPTYTDTDFFTGLGFWTRANPELCLLATRGHPKRLSAMCVS